MSLSASVIIAIWGNILSVVGIVICNKYITEKDGYDFMIFLSFLHFLFTSLGTQVMLRLNYFEYKAAPLSGVLPVAIGSLLSVAFMNLNLATNSVGFYQVCYFYFYYFSLLPSFYIKNIYFKKIRHNYVYFNEYSCQSLFVSHLHY